MKKFSWDNLMVLLYLLNVWIIACCQRLLAERLNATQFLSSIQFYSVSFSFGTSESFEKHVPISSLSDCFWIYINFLATPRQNQKHSPHACYTRVYHACTMPYAPLVRTKQSPAIGQNSPGTVPQARHSRSGNYSILEKPPKPVVKLKTLFMTEML